MKYWKRVNYKSDKETVSIHWDTLSVTYHYNFIENSIIKYISKAETVLDVGSGFGHWIDFYINNYNSIVEAVEPGNNEYLVNKYKCYIQNFKSNKKYDVINAIGVFHHIMNDSELIKAINICLNNLNDSGILIIGTRFDFITSPNEKKRKYRTLDKWGEILKDFEIIGLERSNPPFNCRKHLDILFCRKI